MIENLQDGLYQLENKQAKGAKLGANITQEAEGEKSPKTFFKVLSLWDWGKITKLVSNGEQNMLYNKSQQIFIEKTCLC